MADTARRLKRRNPAVKVLFYLNAFINWPGYESFKTYWRAFAHASVFVNLETRTARIDWRP